MDTICRYPSHSLPPSKAATVYGSYGGVAVRNPVVPFRLLSLIALISITYGKAFRGFSWHLFQILNVLSIYEPIKWSFKSYDPCRSKHGFFVEWLVIYML